ncbi:MAG TPA: S1/P1 nuclease [Gammaproteobacteria bacterium]
MKRWRASGRIAVFLLAALSAPTALAFGPFGHRVAGRIAEPFLCPAASAAVERLGAGEALAELGLWADRIRGNPRWESSAPWHYMNIDEGAQLDDYVSPPQGDVLWAIAHFRARLANAAMGRETRAEALRFLTHFVVDLHQPLHVGRQSDRGGNTITVSFGDERASLHRFWDTDAISGSDLPPERFVATLQPLVRVLAASYRHADERGWAAESLALRRAVYDFDAARGQLTDEYRMEAAEILRLRLAQAGLRLAAEINAALCPHRRASLGP